MGIVGFLSPQVLCVQREGDVFLVILLLRLPLCRLKYTHENGKESEKKSQWREREKDWMWASDQEISIKMRERKRKRKRKRERERERGRERERAHRVEGEMCSLTSGRSVCVECVECVQWVQQDVCRTVWPQRLHTCCCCHPDVCREREGERERRREREREGERERHHEWVIVRAQTIVRELSFVWKTSFSFFPNPTRAIRCGRFDDFCTQTMREADEWKKKKSKNKERENHITQKDRESERVREWEREWESEREWVRVREWGRTFVLRNTAASPTFPFFVIWNAESLFQKTLTVDTYTPPPLSPSSSRMCSPVEREGTHLLTRRLPTCVSVPSSYTPTTIPSLSLSPSPTEREEEEERVKERREEGERGEREERRRGEKWREEKRRVDAEGWMWVNGKGRGGGERKLTEHGVCMMEGERAEAADSNSQQLTATVSDFRFFFEKFRISHHFWLK
jgi:hypothetical protein